MPSNIWGSGGLFEQALQNKMERQASETALNNSRVGVDMFNADTQRMNSDRSYDLGLRRNEVERGTLGVNQSNAATNRFDAETKRLDVGRQLRGLVDDKTASNLGLSTFSPIKLGMMNGGLALKPKMMKQPGYMNGGKVKMPKGYKTGGVIGDVAKDTGKDTVDVKAREGEYFLNPMTVAKAFGEGNYEQGVRNLNQIVRETTGKEPGPTPVGKSGEPGFANSGALVPIPGTGRTGYVPNFTMPSAQPVIDVTPTAPAQAAPAQAASASRGLGYEAGKALRQALPSAQTVRAVTGNVLPAGVAAGESWANMSDKSDFYNSPDVPAAEKFKQTLRDLARPAATAVGGTIGFGAGSVASPVLGSIAGAAAGATAARAGIDKLVDAEGDAYRAFRAANPKAQPAAPVAAKPAEAKVDNDPFKDANAKKLAEADAAMKKEPTLREFYMSQLKELKDDDARLGGVIGSARRNKLEETIMNRLADVESTDATRAKNANTAAMQLQKDTDERLDKNFTMTQVDDKGKVTKVPDPDQVRAFRQHMQEQGIDIYSQPRAMQDKLAREFALRYRGNQRFNERQAAEGGQVSDALGAYEIDPNGVGFGAAMRYKGVTAGDALRAWNPFTSDATNMLVRNPATGEAVPASEVFRNETGGFDAEAFRQAQRDAQSLRNLRAQVEKK